MPTPTPRPWLPLLLLAAATTHQRADALAVAGIVQDGALAGARRVACTGTACFVAATRGGPGGAGCLAVLSIADAAAPRLVVALEDESLRGAAGVAVAPARPDGGGRRIVYVASADAHALAVVDATKEPAPRVVGAATDADVLRGACAVAVTDAAPSFAYVAARGADAVVVVDVTDVTAPKVAMRVPLSGAWDVAAAPLHDLQSTAIRASIPPTARRRRADAARGVGKSANSAAAAAAAAAALTVSSAEDDVPVPDALVYVASGHGMRATVLKAIAGGKILSRMGSLKDTAKFDELGAVASAVVSGPRGVFAIYSTPVCKGGNVIAVNVTDPSKLTLPTLGEMHAFGGFGYPPLQGARHVAVFGDVAYVAGGARGTIAAVDIGTLVAQAETPDEVVDDGLAALDGLGLEPTTVLEHVSGLAVAGDGAALVAVVDGASEVDSEAGAYASAAGSLVVLE